MRFDKVYCGGRMVFSMFVTMFFLLSKILDFLFNPFYWVAFLFLIGLILISKGRKSGRKWLVSAFILLIVFTNPLIISWTMNSWQISAYPTSQIKEPFEYGILMGGSMRHYDEDIERPVYSMSVDRLLQTIALFKKGKIRKIILTGGSGHVFNQNEKESFYVAEVLKQSGIPDSVIFIEDLSRNTYENAVFTRDLIKEKNLQGNFLLITSAFHMRRSVACFKKAGLIVEPYPVDGKLENYTFTPDSFIPEPFYFTLWDQLLHEWAGMAAYKFSGYI